jgi:hypothetical protein
MDGNARPKQSSIQDHSTPAGPLNSSFVHAEHKQDTSISLKYLSGHRWALVLGSLDCSIVFLNRTLAKPSSLLIAGLFLWQFSSERPNKALETNKGVLSPLSKKRITAEQACCERSYNT